MDYSIEGCSVEGEEGKTSRSMVWEPGRLEMLPISSRSLTDAVGGGVGGVQTCDGVISEPRSWSLLR